jgi:hypothetical protein
MMHAAQHLLPVLVLLQLQQRLLLTGSRAPLEVPAAGPRQAP